MTLTPLFSDIRYPSNWNNIIKNLCKLQLMDNITLFGNTVISNYNIFHLNEIVEFYENFNVPYILTIAKNL
jgi:sulfatase maturation enzyme AslB (radical SAM superfamily)